MSARVAKPQRRALDGVSSTLARSHARRCRWAVRLLLGLALMAWPVSATAAASVLVLGVAPTPPSPGLVESLRIQLAHTAAVQPGPELAGETLDARKREAAELRHRAQATWAVWVEPEPADAPAGAAVVLYVVGDGPAVVERRLAAAPGPAADRALALLVSEALGAAAAGAGTPPSTSGTASYELETSEAAGAWALLLEAGASLATGAASADLQAGLALALGAHWRQPGMLVELYGGVRIVSPMSVEQPAGRLDARDVPVVVGARLLFVSEHVAVGGLLEPGLRLIDVEGLTPRGATGSTFRAAPTLRLAPELRFLANDWLAVRMALGAEVALQRQRFAVNEVPLLDLGPARAVAEISLVGTIR